MDAQYSKLNQSIFEQYPKIGNVTPYPFQFEIIEAIKAYIRDQWAQCKASPGRMFEPALVEAYVSAGKTVILAAIAHYLSKVSGGKARTLILARTGELVEQNSEECWNMDTKNSIFSASLNRKSIHYPVVVGTEKTVSNALFKALIDFNPHIILIDECHEVYWREVMELLKNPEHKTSNCYAIILATLIRRRPSVAIIGVTGTPYRGIESIIGPFWKCRIGPKIDREFLVDNGYILPTVFGYSELEYDMHDFDGVSKEGTEDFSAADLKKMGDKADKTLTHTIMREVISLTQKRLGVLITCASEKHCHEAAFEVKLHYEATLRKRLFEAGVEFDDGIEGNDLYNAAVIAGVDTSGGYAIITQNTGKKLRRELLARAKTGDIKFVFQIGCLTTGVNVPFWDTSVILRRIASLTLLVQLLGRGMRLLKPAQVEAGLKKTEHLCLDYAGTMEDMQKMYDDPILNAADLERSRKRKKEFKICPVCKEKNSKHARRCAVVKDGKRCDHFFEFKICPNPDCGCKVDKCARECGNCGHQLVDPNANLNGKHYGPDDWKPVLGMDISKTKNGGIYVKINFACADADGKPEIAKLFFNPWSSQGAKRVWEHNFVNKFVASWPDRKLVSALPNADAVIGKKELFRIPQRATHRIGQRGSVVHGLDFGAEVTMGGKNVSSNK